MKRFPGDATRIKYPALIASRITARRVLLLPDRLPRGSQALCDYRQVLVGFDLQAEVVQTRGSRSGSDRKIHPRIVEHPFGVVRFQNGRLRPKSVEQKRIEDSKSSTLA